MTEAVLTLQIPRGSRFIPIAMTANENVLRLFKRQVILDCERQEKDAMDEVEALTHRAEIERLKKILDVLIPDINR
jgi:hypothetical protein